MALLCKVFIKLLCSDVIERNLHLFLTSKLIIKQSDNSDWFAINLCMFVTFKMRVKLMMNYLSSPFPVAKVSVCVCVCVYTCHIMRTGGFYPQSEDSFRNLGHFWPVFTN